MTTLIIPSVKKKNGTGHLKRCLYLAGQLSGKGQTCRFFLDTPPNEADELRKRFPSLADYTIHTDYAEISPVPDRILMDNRETSLTEWLRWEKLAPVISLDEGGESRRYSSFLIDTFPSLSKEEANASANPLFRTISRDISGRNRVEGSLLITFGGEDPAGLTAPALERILSRGGEKRDIGVVQGPLCRDLTLPDSVTLYKAPESLDELFQRYETVITSFGLTPYEAREAGCRVILLNPTAYHEELSKSAGFLSAGVGAESSGKVPELIENGSRETDGSGERAPFLHDLLDSIGTAPEAECPLCSREANPVLVRFGNRSFYRCSECGNYYLVNWNREEEEYDREYFFGRYKAQYGKTYLEDFENIKTMGAGRIARICRSLSVKGQAMIEGLLLTDLGCAFGPFLAAASEKGFQCRGVEINEDGAAWIEENLAIPVIRGSLQDPVVSEELQARPGDVTTLWYVIEHIQNQKELLAELSLSLRAGGVLAFGTPSGSGISAKRDLSAFLEKSPGDHYVIYTPRGVRRLLKQSGFHHIRIKSVGHHPERFGRWVGKKGSFSYNVVLLMSRLFSLGDSLEVYAVKSTE